MKANSESKVQRDIWKCKDDAYKEVAHLELGQALRKRLEDSAKRARGLRKTASTDRR